MLRRDIHEIRRNDGDGGINIWRCRQKAVHQVNNMSDGYADEYPHPGNHEKFTGCFYE